MSGTRRAACDRCHGQKMRCIREGAHAKCNRCFDARADCVFSIARKAGRPPANCRKGLSTSERDGSDGKSSTKPMSSPHSLNDERHWEHSRPATSSTDLSAGDISRDLDVDFAQYFLENSGSVSLFEDVSSPTVSFGIDGSSTAISTASCTKAHPCLPWSEDYDQTLDQHLSCEYLDEEGQANEEAVPGTFAALPSSPQCAYQPQIEGTSHGPQKTGRKRERVLALESEDLILGAEACETGSDSESYVDSAGGDTQANTMQQLSELGQKLFAHTTSGPWKRSAPRHRHSYASRDKYYNSSLEGDTSVGVDDANVQGDPNDQNYKGQSTPTNGLDKLTAHVIESSRTFYKILRHIPPQISFDMTATMLILTTYIRLAQLHHTLYALIQSILVPSDTYSPPAALAAPSYPTQRSSDLSPSYNANKTTTTTKTTATADASTRPSTLVPFPYLQIGGVSLAVYPRFQLKFILQICVHHLGEVELLLGLPAESCVGGGRVSQRHRASDGEDGGILHRNTGGMTLLVRTIMMEANETVKGIRRVLTGLMEETRASIQI